MARKKIGMEEAIARFARATMPGSLTHMSIVTQCVQACEDHFGGLEPSPKAVEEFVQGVAHMREWTATSAPARKSEVRVIVRQYQRLQSACEAVVEDDRCNRFTWHNAVRVARLCETHNNKTLVAAYYEN